MKALSGALSLVSLAVCAGATLPAFWGWAELAVSKTILAVASVLWFVGAVKYTGQRRP